MGRKKVKEVNRKVSKTVSMTNYEWLHLVSKAGDETVGSFLVRSHELKNEPLPPDSKGS